MIRALTLLAIVGCSPAHAQVQQCLPYPAFVQTMADVFGETRHMLGVVSGEQIVLLFANPETGTWTFAYTDTSGVTCMVSSGTNFDNTVAALPPNG